MFDHLAPHVIVNDRAGRRFLTALGVRARRVGAARPRPNPWAGATERRVAASDATDPAR